MTQKIWGLPVVQNPNMEPGTVTVGEYSDLPICARCKHPLLPNPRWTEADKEAETKALFGDIPADQRARVCDPCFQAMMRGRDMEPAFQAARERLREKLSQGCECRAAKAAE